MSYAAGGPVVHNEEPRFAQTGPSHGGTTAQRASEAAEQRGALFATI